MAKTNFKELQKLNVEDIKKQITELSQKLFDLKMQNVGGQLKDFTQIGKSKIQIAQLKTLLVQKGSSPNVVIQYSGVKMAAIKKEETKKEVKEKKSAEAVKAAKPVKEKEVKPKKAKAEAKEKTKEKHAKKAKVKK